MKYVMKGILSLSVILGMVACSDKDESDNTQGTARISIQLVDAPGDYDAVYIDVQDVVVKYQGTNDEVPIGEINTGVYNLLELTGGVSVLLVDEQLPAGEISQIRLVLGTNNSIDVDGQSYPLSTPSAQQSGLKIQLNETLEEDVFYEYILDFDVEKSIVVQGNGGYILKPVIRASLVADAGKISGQVLPVEIQTLITATDGTNEVSAYANAEGNFMLYGLPEGNYTVTYEADPLLGFPPVVVPDVAVIAGLTTEMDLVVFE